jgi:hypothetical protein
MPQSSDPNARRVSILRAELDSANAMISLVKYTREPELIRKYKEVALRSYLSAMDLVAITTLSPKDEEEIWDQSSAIRQWLDVEGFLR